MLDMGTKTSLYIENRYKEILELYINHEGDDIYYFVPHSSRYNTLNYTLKLAFLPLTIISGVIGYFTFGTFSLKYFNIGKIFSNKMNQNISKKVLYGLPEKNDKYLTIPKIVEHVLKQYEKLPDLIVQSESSLLEKLTKKAAKYIPGFSKFMNFWNQGGITYSDEMQKKQLIIDLIYKKIISEAYIQGKKSEKLEIADIKKLFPKVDFEEKVELDIKEVVITNDSTLCKQPVLEQTFEKTIEPINITNDQEIILENSLACNQQPIEQNTEKSISNLNNPINPLINLAALYLCNILCDSLIKTFEEHCTVEYICSQKLSTTSHQGYTEPSPCYDNALLGNDSPVTVIACC